METFYSQFLTAMKILFIYPNIKSGSSIHVHPGLASLSAVLKQGGHNVCLIDLSVPMNREEFQTKVKEYDPDVVGISTSTHQWQFAKQYAVWVRQAVSSPIICGGYHPTLVPEEVMETPGIDWVVQGEGEEALQELVVALEQGQSPNNIPNVWGGPDKVRNAVRPPIGDLDTLPFPDLEIFDMNTILFNTAGMVEYMLGRGCPFACTYCCNPQWNAVYRGSGKVVRKYSVLRAIAELEYQVNKFHARGFQFNDEIFTMNKEWVRDFTRLYREKIHLPFQVLLRVDFVNDEMMEMLAGAGCMNVEVGVECGNEDFRRRVLKRNMSNDAIRHVFRKAEELGMKTHAFIMLGLPTEKPSETWETVEFTRDLRPDHVQLSVFHPYPRTPLYDLCMEKGYMTGKVSPTFLSDDSVLNQPQLPQQVIRQAKRAIRDISLRDKIEKQPLGIYDFVINLDKARIKAPNREFVQATVFGEYYNYVVTLVCHPPALITYKLSVPENVVLRTAIGLNQEIWNKRQGDAVRFTITLKCGRQKRELFSKSINPKYLVEDQRWHPLEIPLTEWAGKKVELCFQTEPDPRDNSHSWAGWARPHLARLDDPKPWYFNPWLPPY
jgi:anaerobic magnesium-protoporphyrin IX monomethyl ester cyclase